MNNQRNEFEPSRSAASVQSAYAGCREGASALPKAERYRLFWLGYLDREGHMKEEGQAFSRAMEDALRNWHLEGGCTSCGGVFHPATGHMLSETSQLCGPCARDFLAWLKAHTRRKWGKLNFYEHAARKRVDE